MKKCVFITGNQNKADYLAKLLDLKISHQKVELNEIQSIDIREVVSHKAREAFDIVGEPVLIEDVSLEFHALNGLPGPFIKFFVEGSGLEATCKMLSAFADKSATAKCVYGYYDGTNLELIEGAIKGAISDGPSAGAMGFGWDKIFIPEGFGGRTRADLDQGEYDTLYREIKSIDRLREFLSSN